MPASDLAAADSSLVDTGHELTASLERLRRYADQAWTENTRKAYRSDWQHFSAWCSEQRRSPLPASVETVALYLGALVDDHALATIERRLSTISAAHREAKVENPTSVKDGMLMSIWKGIVREKTRYQDKAEPLLVEELKTIVQCLPRDPDTNDLFPDSYRDRAIILVGWAGALRRSELVSLECRDVEFIKGSGMNLTIRQGKTDQEGRGLIKGIPYGAIEQTCPVTSLRIWLRVAQITEGPLFRRFYRGGRVGDKALTAQYVSVILKKHAERVGIDSSRLSAHSLRSGFITQAIRSGKSERRVKEHSGHKSWDTFNRYVKQSSTFLDNPLDNIGL